MFGATTADYVYSSQSKEWIGGGTPLQIDAEYHGMWYTLPFGFVFSGLTYTQVYVSSEGLLSFSEEVYYGPSGNDALVNKVAIAPLWSDWGHNWNGKPYVFQPDEDSVGFRWVKSIFDGVDNSDAHDLNFEVILYRDGRIRFNYDYQGGRVYLPIISGISKGDGATYHLDTLENLFRNMSAVYTPVQDWLTYSNPYWLVYSNPVNAPAGQNVLYYYSVDSAGNTEAINSQLFKVEIVLPTASITSPLAGALCSGTPTLTYTASEGTVVVKVDGVTVDKVSGNNLDQLADGSHTVRVEVTDAVMRMGYTEVTFTVDDHIPAVIIISPAAGLTDDTTPELLYIVSNGAISVTLDGVAISKVSGNSLDVLDNGSHTIRVEAVNELEHMGSDEVTFIVSAPPSVAITSPSVGATKNKTPLLTYTVNEGIVTVKVDGAVVTKTSGTTLDELIDGSHVVRVEAVNADGFTGFAEVEFTVDTVVPVVDITSPLAGYVPGNNPVLVYTASEGVVVTTLDGVAINKASGDILAALAVGDHIVRVEATDDAGNVDFSEVGFTIGMGAPTVNMTSPASGITNNAQPLLTYTASDGTIVVKVDGGEVSKVSGDTLDALVDGYHMVRVEATTATNYTGVAEVAFTVDTSAPAISTMSPIGSTNDNTPLLTYIVSESTVTVRVMVDQVMVNTISGGSLDVLSDGTHTVSIEAVDNAGNLGYAQATFIVDTVSPVVAITAPGSGMTNNTMPILSYTASEGTVVVKVDDTAVTKVSGDTLAALLDGPHTVRVEATDVAGNTGSAQVTFTVDTTPPTVTIISPIAGTTNTTTLPLIYTASEGAVVVKLDSTVIGKVSGDSLDILDNGGHTVRVEATDTAGNTGVAEVTFTVDTSSAGNDDTNIYCNGTATIYAGASSFTSGISIPQAGSGAISISSPLEGAAITGPNVIVKGAMDTTVPVTGVLIVVTSGTGTTGYLAQVNGAYFGAKVQVTSDTTSISAIATDQTGTQHQASISVAPAIQTDTVDLTANPSVGLPTLKQSGKTTLDVSLSSTPSIPTTVASYAWDVSGTGSNNVTCYSHSDINASYEQTGLYLTTVTVANAAGQTYKDTVIVNVLDRAEVDSRLKPIWSGMKNALVSGNVSEALNSILPASRQKYSDAFTALQANLPEIAAGMQDIELVYVNDVVIKYRIRRDQIIDGQMETITYYIYFSKNADGIWQIEQF